MNVLTVNKPAEVLQAFHRSRVQIQLGNIVLILTNCSHSLLLCLLKEHIDPGVNVINKF